VALTKEKYLHYDSAVVYFERLIANYPRAKTRAMSRHLIHCAEKNGNAEKARKYLEREMKDL
jgi:TolA-binding protein